MVSKSSGTAIWPVMKPRQRILLKSVLRGKMDAEAEPCFAGRDHVFVCANRSKTEEQREPAR
jgi:hypothetical protein